MKGARNRPRARVRSWLSPARSMLALLALVAVWYILALAVSRRRHPAAGPGVARQLPRRIVAAYASWSQCDAKVDDALRNGANVLIWFSANLELAEGVLYVGGALPNMSCVGATVRRYPAAIHMMAVGGWNAPLPSLAMSGPRWFRAWHAWNQGVAEQHGWRGFDGVDWDLEGNDRPGVNVFTTAHLDLVGQFSVAARAAGYFVSMAPAQSYLDVEEARFDTDVTHAPGWRSEFQYHGRNLYAYMLVFYGVESFDWVSLQLYEKWSRADYRIAMRGDSPSAYLAELVGAMERGWTVDFGRLGRHIVRVPRSKLVLVVANGWTQPHPPAHGFLYIDPTDLRRACDVTDSLHRGFMFWTIMEEGKQVLDKPLYMTTELAAMLDE